ncbi:LysR substrate-binding domain-containing protein [Dongshaea marina]|uniref:LysR substrate-binding domain-containing protein n=1 Tax=Dongshaea marina TaxID=2047966 RepID=UPI000D3E332C|nr:LysR substrate-binding domain-containing protein [Dongshaea marina]
MRITLKQLRAFCAIARSGNLGIAAESLHLSKASVSLALQELEKQLDTKLFDRVHPRLILNSDGRRLQPHAEELLVRAGDIEGLFQPQALHHFDLRLGFSQTIGNYLMPALLADFGRECGEVTNLSITNSRQLCHHLCNFEMDLAIIEGGVSESELSYEPWLSDKMLVVVHPDHPLANGQTHEVEQLAGQSWVLRENESASREQFEVSIGARLSSKQGSLILNSPEAVIRSVEQGLGITFISELAARRSLQAGRLSHIHLDQEFSRQFFMVWHHSKHHSMQLRQFIEYCRGWASARQAAF